MVHSFKISRQSFIVLAVYGAHCIAGPSKQKDEPGPPGAVLEMMEAAIDELAANAQLKPPVERFLEEIKPEQAAAAVVHILRNDRERWLDRDDSRLLVSFRMLTRFGAAETPKVRERLVAGLRSRSPRVRKVCYAALGEEAVQELVSDKIEILTGRDTPEHEKVDTLRTMAEWGPYARSGFDVILALFKDAAQKDRLRAFATYALLRNDPERAVEALREVDRPGLAGALGQVWRVGGETGGTFDSEDKAVRAKVRAFLRERMQDPDREVRAEALRAFLVAYPKEEALLGNDAEGYIINPEIRDALELMARRDPDQGLRDRARRMIEGAEEELRIEGKARQQP